MNRKKSTRRKRSKQGSKVKSDYSTVASGYENVNAPKVVVLGADGSGRSTVFKQIELRFGNEMDKLELEVLRKDVHRSVAEGILALLALAKVLDKDFFDQVENKERLEEMPIDVIVDPNVGKLMKSVWNCAAAQETWKERGRSIPESLQYFMQHIDRISDDSYLPTTLDYLYISVTSGTITTAYIYCHDAPFRVCDIGTESTFFLNAKKQQALMDTSACFVFTVSISEYDQMSSTHEDQTYVESSLALFKTLLELVKSKTPDAPVILIFNKLDLLRPKLHEIPFRIEGERFDSFPGSSIEEGAMEDQAVNEVVDYLKGLFLGLNEEYQCKTDFVTVNGMKEEEYADLFGKLESIMEAYPKP